MTIQFVDVGTRAASSLDTFDVAHPATVVAGNLLILLVGTKYPTSKIGTPGGWTAPSNNEYVGGQGSAGNDAGNVTTQVFVKEAIGTEGGTNLSITATGNDVTIAQMLRYSKASGSTWGYECTGNADNNASSAWAITGSATLGVIANDMVLALNICNGNLSTWANQAMTQAGVTYGTAQERIDDSSSAGGDIGIFASEHPASSGTASGNPVHTATATGTGANSPAGAGVILRLREVTGTTYNDSFSIARRLSNTESLQAGIAGSVSLSRRESTSTNVLGTYNTNISLSRRDLVSLSSLASFSVSFSLIKRLSLSSVGGLSVADVLSISRQVSIASASLSSVNESISLGKRLGISDITNVLYFTSVSLVRTESISLFSTATFEVAISLLRDLAITLIGEAQAQTYEDAFSLARSVALSTIAGTVYEDAFVINKQLTVSLLSGLLIEGAFNLSKRNTVLYSNNLTLNENISLTSLFGLSDGSVADMIGQLLLGKSLVISNNVQMVLETDVSLGTILAIQINGGQAFDEALVMSIYKAIALSSSLVQFVGEIPAKITLNDQIIWLVKANDRLLH